jgi:hypothetical protein
MSPSQRRAVIEALAAAVVADLEAEGFFDSRTPERTHQGGGERRTVHQTR